MPRLCSSWQASEPQPPHFSKGAGIAACLPHGAVKRPRSCLVSGCFSASPGSHICAKTITFLLEDAQGDTSASPSVHCCVYHSALFISIRKWRSLEDTWVAHRIGEMNNQTQKGRGQTRSGVLGSEADCWGEWVMVIFLSLHHSIQGSKSQDRV